MPRKPTPRPSPPTHSNSTSQPTTTTSTPPKSTTLPFKPAPPPPPPPGPTPPTPIPASRIRAFRIPALVILSGITLYISSLPTYTYITYKRDAERLRHNPPPADASARFQSLAPDYDARIGLSEWVLGIENLRAQLLAKARGHVLEVAVGTGRNAECYPLTKGVKSVTMVDQSSEMVRVARMNWAKKNAYFINAVFRIQGAEDAVPPPRDPRTGEVAQEGFDTVVQTMGVCSEGDAVGVLRNLGRMCVDGGRILLLEHGRSRYEWVNGVLDGLAPAHAERWGCWFNKDVGAVVRESGLEVVEERRYHFGTTWWFVLKPPKNRRVLEDQNEQIVPVNIADEAKPRPWWAAWWK